MIAIVIKNPGEDARKELRTSEEIYEILGFATIYMDMTRRINKAQQIRAWGNDDAIRLRLPFNMERPTDGAPMYGPIIVAGLTQDEDGIHDWCSLNDDEYGPIFDFFQSLEVN